MTPQDLNDLIAAKKVADDLYKLHNSDMTVAAYNYLKACEAAREKFFAENVALGSSDDFDTYDECQWVTIADRVTIHQGQGPLVVYFIQRGTWGDPDETVQSMPFTADLLTTDGQHRLVGQFIERLTESYEDYVTTYKQAKVHRIAALEKELAKLREDER